MDYICTQGYITLSYYKLLNICGDARGLERLYYTAEYNILGGNFYNTLVMSSDII